MSCRSSNVGPGEEPQKPWNREGCCAQVPNKGDNFFITSIMNATLSNAVLTSLILSGVPSPFPTSSGSSFPGCNPLFFSTSLVASIAARSGKFCSVIFLTAADRHLRQLKKTCLIFFVAVTGLIYTYTTQKLQGSYATK